MKKVKFKCGNCKVPTKRPVDRVLSKNGKQYCSDYCYLTAKG